MTLLVILFFVLLILAGGGRKIKSKRSGPIISYGRNPEILEMERQEKEYLKQGIIERHGEDGYLWRSGPISLRDFLDGVEIKPQKVSVKEALKEIDEPTIINP